MGSVVDREALFARLDGPPGRSVAWIAGPPGSGKSTLAATYLKSRRLRSVWYQIDADDADPASFFHFLRHAASKIPGARDRDLPTFSPRHADDVPAFSRAFFRELFARAGAPLALVLDNLESVAAEQRAAGGPRSRLFAGAERLLRHRDESRRAARRARAPARRRAMCARAGADLTVVAATRSWPSRARAARSSPPKPPRRLHERTQGWVAGLVLMLEHSRFSGRVVDLPERRHAAGDLRLPRRRDLRPLRSGNARVPAADRLPAADDGRRWPRRCPASRRPGVCSSIWP